MVDSKVATQNGERPDTVEICLPSSVATAPRLTRSKPTAAEAQSRPIRRRALLRTGQATIER